jgi:hypothetical protein
MRVKVTDASGRPIAGARVVGRSSGERRRFPEPPKTDLERQLERLASSLWRDYAAQARSGADGVVDIPVFTFDGMQARVEVRRGDATCEPFVLEAGGETAIVLGPR